MKKIIFFGTPDHSVTILQSFYKNEEIEVVAVVTNPDRAVGRKKIITKSPIKKFAEVHNIPAYSPEKYGEGEIKNLQKYNADFFIIVAYGMLIPQNIIDIPSQGTFNLHFSLLPKYRGASPVQSSILSGDEVSGISIFKLVKKMDAGDIFIQKEYKLIENNISQNYLEAWQGMIELGTQELTNLIHDFEHYSGIEQDESQATFCGKFSKSDGEIFPAKETSMNILKKYNAFYLWPGIFLFDENNKRIKLLKIKYSDKKSNCMAGQFFIEEKRLFLSTSEGILEILQLQKEGKKPIDGINIIQGF